MEVVSYNSYAGFVKRLIAFVIDSIVIRVLLLWFIFGFSMDHYGLFRLRHIFHWHTLVTEMCIMAYFVICETSSWQGTLGKKLLGMKVANAKTFTKINTQDAVMRFLGKYISFGFFLLGFIWIIFDDRKQGWHDKLADTIVIEG